ncbi:hypothetical protein C823_001583 [Eubacterium plexicaudatum ASF492]|uniref:DUF3784 domain-containing protein n=1 Tax=Eubacterium plexicaudatum ASF492 TaxID=1235802 RepID=N2BDD6_9FIRM|nr:hypothetical protein C823_001583 [Eubacterium plexicaudatum ASF492]
MSSEIIVLIFDLIILMFGAVAIYAAVRMKKTGEPSAILIPKEEQQKVRNAEQFCTKMYQPTILFGLLICLYGAVDIWNRQMLKAPALDLLSIACFLIVCIWYVRKLREVKEEHV